MKSIIATGILLTSGSAAMAGPYANIENNTGWLDGDFQGGVTEVHAGVELGDFYVQGGPAYFSVAGEEGYVEYSGKAGVGVDLSEKMAAYGEVSVLTEDKEFDFKTLNVGTKVGATYKF